MSEEEQLATPGKAARLAMREYQLDYGKMRQPICLCRRTETHEKYADVMSDTSSVDIEHMFQWAKVVFPKIREFCIKREAGEAPDEQGRPVGLFRWSLWEDKTPVDGEDDISLAESEWLATELMAAQSLDSIVRTTALDFWDGKVPRRLPIVAMSLPCYQERCSSCMLLRYVPESQ